MGRRTTSTTKGGKFMNPTDQARKEARRRELKKNKKQRIAVRQAVIKTKDPQQMIKELEDLDDMDLDPTSETHYNEKVIKDKRRKLLETLFRVVDFYFKEDQAKGREFKAMIENYKLNRAKKEMYYESVKNAQTVEINNIPLPEAPFETPHLSDIPLPGIKPQSILKKIPPGPPSGLPPTTQAVKKTPPGPPPGIPPAKKVFGRPKASEVVTLSTPADVEDDVDEEKMDDDEAYDPEQGPELIDKSEAKFNLPEDMEDDDDEFHHRDDDDDEGNQSEDEDYADKKRTVRFADNEEDDEGNDNDASDLSSTVTPLQAMMLKMAGQSIRTTPNQRNLDKQDDDEEDQDEDDKEVGGRNQPKPPGPPPGLPPGPPPGMPPGIMPRPSGIMPPGPPPGRPPTMPPGMSHRPEVHRMMNRPEEGRMPEHRMRMMQNPNILSAPPSLIHRPSDKEIEDVPAATITAKPKLTTNPKVDSTRFMPTSLRIRREVKGKPCKAAGDTASTSVAEKQRLEKKKKQETSTADAAYDSFMKEMQGLL